MQQPQLAGAVLGLAKCRIGDGAYEYGLGCDALRPGFGQLLQQAGCIEFEFGGRAEFRHSVAVVGVKPTGHLAGAAVGVGGTAGFGRDRRTAAGRAKVVVQRIAFEALHPFGQIAQRKAHVQYLVVERGVAHGHPVQLLSGSTVALAQLGAQRLECIARGLASLVGLQRELQFALCADARKAQVVNSRHAEIQSCDFLPMARVARVSGLDVLGVDA